MRVRLNLSFTSGVAERLKINLKKYPVVWDKLTDLEKRFYETLRKRYEYLCELLHRGSSPYEGTKYRPDFVLDLPEHPRFRGVVIEMQGGIFQQSKTGHSTASKLIRDYDKCVVAQSNGFFFLPVPPTKDGIENACELLDKLYTETQDLV